MITKKIQVSSLLQYLMTMDNVQKVQSSFSNRVRFLKEKITSIEIIVETWVKHFDDLLNQAEMVYLL